MSYKKGLALFLLFPLNALATGGNDENSCKDFLALLNRPSVLDSPCAVEYGQVVIEGGYQYQWLHDDNGHAQKIPEAILRFGLPARNELLILPPTYINENPADEEQQTGSTATIVGIKHQFPITPKWIYAAESLVTIPGGNDHFGSEEWGIAVNGIASYSITDTFSATVMLGFTSETTSFDEGGERFNSFNPDIVFAWEAVEDTQFYVEFYGQTKTGPDEDSGYNGDGGIQYLITENIEVDLEYGWRMSGELDGFSQYIGCGGAVRF